MRTLQNDPRGTAAWIEREARGMDPMQSFREFVQNGIEAGGDTIIVDGWTDPDTGHTLARISDNGSGLSPDQLVQRLTTLHGQFKGADNYGVGARIAALPFNQGGVTFASKNGAFEGMVKLHKVRGVYGLETWETIDEAGYSVQIEVAAPDDGMLDRVIGSTGTAVILHGDGQSDTWNTTKSYQVSKFLSNRYYDFGENVTVRVEKPGDGLRKIAAFGDFLADHALADGEVPFKDIAGMNGVMYWWTLPTPNEMKAKLDGRFVMQAGVGLFVDNEVFEYSKTYLGDFGIFFKSVESRVAILVSIADSEMDTARAGVVLPGEARKTIPWKKLGAHFANNLPDAIDEMMSAVTVSTSSLDEDQAKKLDEEWFKKLSPIKVVRAAEKGDPGSGEENGDAAPVTTVVVPRTKRKVNPNPTPRPKPAPIDHAGDQPSNVKDLFVTPRITFTDDFDWSIYTYGIVWLGNNNTVLVSTDFPPYTREIERWIETTGMAKSLVTVAVQHAYQLELAATIVDANAQDRAGLTPEQVTEMKEPAALYTKLLGMQAITASVAETLKRMSAKA